MNAITAIFKKTLNQNQSIRKEGKKYKNKIIK